MDKEQAMEICLDDEFDLDWNNTEGREFREYVMELLTRETELAKKQQLERGR